MLPNQPSSRRAAFGGMLTGEGATPPALTNLPPGLPQPPSPQPQVQSQQRNDKGKQRSQAQPDKFAAKGAPMAKANGAKVTKQSTAPTTTTTATTTTVAKVVDEVDDSTICFICAEVAQYWAVGECGHRTCHTCAIRLRALYKRTDCTFCKHECPRVVFTTSPSLPFSSFPGEVTLFSDTKLGLAFETRSQMEDSLSLLRFNCPASSCAIISQGWADLKRHVQHDHQSSLCDLCCINKKIFTHEHEIYGNKELMLHIGAEHMQCEFCRITFYDSDGLYKHCREKHEECFICVRSGIRHQYHRNYDRLEAHYKTSHYLCPHPTCLQQKFVVFETELDLQAHAVDVHGASHSGDQRSRKDARRIETNFTYDSAAESARGGPRRGRDREREREEMAAPPASFVNTIDQPHRTRNVPGLGGASDSRRGGTGVAGRRDEPPHRGGAGPPASTSNGASEMDPATLAKHTALMKRVTEAVSSDSKVSAFKSAVRGFRSSEMAAEDLVDTLGHIFDHQLDVTNGIITTLAELLDDVEKRQYLLTAWQDVQIQQDSFPSLAPIGPAMNGFPTPSSATPSRRIVNNSSKNTKTSRSVHDPTVWARVERAASSPASTSVAPPPPRERFPALPAASSSRVVPGSARYAQKSTPWSTSTSTTSSAGPSSRSNTPVPPPQPQSQSQASFIDPVAASSAVRRPNASGAAEFPSLPTSTIERDKRARMQAALRKPAARITDAPAVEVGGNGRWGESGMWSGTSTRSVSPANGAPGETGTRETGGTNGEGQMKKKKKGKVLLMSHGSQGRS